MQGLVGVAELITPTAAKERQGTEQGSSNSRLLPIGDIAHCRPLSFSMVASITTAPERCARARVRCASAHSRARGSRVRGQDHRLLHTRPKQIARPAHCALNDCERAQRYVSSRSPVL